MRPTLLAALACLAAFATPAFATVTVDGHIAPGEYAGARHITDFRQTQPLTEKPAEYPVEAWVLSTPQGLAVAVRVNEPPGIVRTDQRVQRDFRDNVDRVNLYVDFNGTGQTAYNFVIASTGAIDDEVITNETHFSSDWDGIWQHAVSQDAQGWTAEFLIPWYTAPMLKARDGKRTIAIGIDRVIANRGLRAAWPVFSYSKPRFVSDFAKIEVAAYSQSLLAVTPYVSALYNNVGHDGSISQGVDIFWKPNGQFQLTATANPDFGQVESDDLVVNFGATESYFSDKRPFFTENQGIFAFSLLDDNSSLIYTRRVGGPADNGEGAGDISGAVKFNGSVGATSYGVLAAQERGDDGRSFTAARVVHDFGDQRLGLLATQVDRPFLDRQANVLGVDHHWQPTARLTIVSNLVGSDIDQHGQTTRGYGATMLADYEMDDGWRQQWAAMHFDDRLQVNDFGYLQRNDMDYAHWEVDKRITTLPADSAYLSHDWSFRVDALNNDHGLRLRREFRVGRQSNLRDGGNENLQLNIDTAAWDDLLTREHGALLLPPSFNFNFSRNYPRKGNWSWQWSAGASTEGLSGNSEVGYELSIEPTYFISDAFNVHVGLDFQRTPDWLVWQYDNLIGRFDQRQVELDAGFNWNMSDRQELRMKLQAIGLDARIRGAYRVTGGRAIPSSDVVDSFGVRNLGMQVRYRYELAPLSYLYVVYGRGGYLLDEERNDVFNLLHNSLSLRNDEQLFIKLNYRFDL